MNLIERVLAQFGYAKAAAPLPGFLRAEASRARWNYDPNLVQAEAQADLYRVLSWVQSAVSHIANTAAVVPFSVYERKGEKWDDTANHPFEQLLDRPNPMQSRSEFLISVISYYRTTGNALWFLNRAGPDEPPVEMWVMQPFKVRPVPDGNSYIRGYLYQAGGIEIPLEPWQVCHLKSFNPLNPYWGLSPIEALQDTAMADLAMQRWNRNFFAEDNAKMQGALAFADNFTDAEWAKLKAQIQDQHGGEKNRTMMLLRGIKQGGVNYVQTGMTQKDMEFLRGREWNRTEIYELYAPGLESMLSASSNRAGSITGKDVFYELAVFPALNAIAEKFNNDILSAYGEQWAGEFDDVRVKDRELELKEQAAAERVLTIAELRDKYYEMAPLGDGRDQLLLAELATGPADTRTPEEKQRMALEIAGATQPKEPAVAVEREEPKQLPPPPEEADKEQAAAKGYDGVMVAFFLPVLEAALLAAIAKQFVVDDAAPDESRAIPVEEMHLTLCIAGDMRHGLPDRQRMETALREFARRSLPVTGKVSGYGEFDGGMEYPVFALFDAPDLPDFRQNLVDLLWQAGVEVDETHGFTPHITLAYNKQRGRTPHQVPVLEMTFGSIWLAYGDEHVEFPLLGEGWDPTEPDARLLEELAKWETKALNRLRRKKSAACDFDSDWIAPEVAEWVADGLEHATTAAEVKAAVKTITRDDLDEWEGMLADALTAIFEKYRVQSVGSIVRDGAVDFSGLEAALRADLTIILEQTLLDALERVIDEVGAGADSEALLLAAREWAAPYGAQSARGLTSNTAKLIESAIRTYRDTPGMTRAQVEALLRVAFSPSRAVTIAVTEITRAAVQATTQYKTILEEAGLTVEEIWQTNNDALVCAICGPRNGEPTNGLFKPPAHQRCRCRITLRIVASAT